jgi:nitroimidazol reductase NimA-like FMN-containing flavoprotein (pyridoxamine 5'-phosphate oxidase superfamily)
MHEPEKLTYAECRGLLAGGVFGRLAVCTPRGAQIFPVNYAVTGEAVVFRTAEDGVIAGCDWSVPMAFEVDFVDYSDHRGWSVVAAGRCERVEGADELAQIRRTWDPRPWASGQRSLYLRLAWTDLTGRRLGGGWTRENELPVRRQL